MGRSGDTPISRDYAPPFAFTGGTIEQAVVDISGKSLWQPEMELASIIARQ